MRSKQFNWMVISLVLLLSASFSQAQNLGGEIYWHIDPNVKTCSMVIDPSLSQGQWHKFVKETGAILSFKSLASANTLGKMNFNIAIDNGYTPVDQHDLAWINTFTHPDADCPLGDVISFPTIRASMGITDNMDIGGYWTVAPEANYGAMGGEFKYAFLQESEKSPAVAARASVSILTGVPDFNLNIYSVDLMTSKKIAILTPYIGLKMSMVIGTETTTKVDLDRESIALAQGYAGISYSIWMLSLAAEYNVSTINTFAFALGFNL